MLSFVRRGCIFKNANINEMGLLKLVVFVSCNLHCASVIKKYVTSRREEVVDLKTHSSFYCC